MLSRAAGAVKPDFAGKQHLTQKLPVLPKKPSWQTFPQEQSSRQAVIFRGVREMCRRTGGYFFEDVLPARIRAASEGLRMARASMDGMVIFQPASDVYE